MHLKSNNIGFLPYDNESWVADEFFTLLVSRYQIGLEILMGGSDIIFNSVHLLY